MGPTASSARIPFERLPPPLHERLAARVRRLGYLGEFFQIGAHQPDALAAFVDFTDALKAALPERLVEIVALTIASVTGNEYERVQHEHLALTGILTLAEVEYLIGLDARDLPASFTAKERAALRLAHAAATDYGAGGGDAYRRLLDLTGEQQAVGCLMMAARYLAHATMANCWQLAPPRPAAVHERTRRA